MDEVRTDRTKRLRCIEVSKFQRRSQTWHQVEEQYIPRRKDFGLSLVDFVRFVDEIRVYGDELIGPRLRCIEVSKFQRRSQTWHQVEEQYIPRRKDFGLSLVDFVRFVISG